MLLDNPSNAYDLFEEYSLRIRNQQVGKVLKFEKEEFDKLKTYIDKTRVMLNVQKSMMVETQYRHRRIATRTWSLRIRSQPYGGSTLV